MMLNNVAPGLSDGDLQKIAMLLHHETEYLNTGRYDDWLSLFTDNGRYWVPLSPEQSDPINEVSLFFEDKKLMQMRILRLTDESAPALALPLRTSRLTGTPVIDGVDAESGQIIAKSRFYMTEYQNDRQRIFSGLYSYWLTHTGDDYRISLKRVDLVNCDSIFESLQVFI